MDCTGRGLTGVPDSIPLDVRRLLLSNNWIPWIPSDFLVLYSDLVYLDLRNNSLSQLEPGTLTTSSRLVFLDLGSNNLTEIPSGTFGESRSLIKLRLGNNPRLTMVGREAFTGLTSLRELELDKNGLTQLDVGILEALPSLRVLRLEGNPWLCNCRFAKLFVWMLENRHKLPKGKTLAAKSFLSLRPSHYLGDCLQHGGGMWWEFFLQHSKVFGGVSAAETCVLGQSITGERRERPRQTGYYSARKQVNPDELVRLGQIS